MGFGKTPISASTVSFLENNISPKGKPDLTQPCCALRKPRVRKTGRTSTSATLPPAIHSAFPESTASPISSIPNSIHRLSRNPLPFVRVSLPENPFPASTLVGPRYARASGRRFIRPNT